MAGRAAGRRAPGARAGRRSAFLAYRGALAALPEGQIDDEETTLPTTRRCCPTWSRRRWCSTSATAKGCLAARDTTRRLRRALTLLKREESLLRLVPSLPGVEYARQAILHQLMAGTPATVALAKAGIAWTPHAYDHDPAAASYGLEAAVALGVDAHRVFKTLVASVDGRLTVAVVPVTGQLDLKALATAVGGKRAEMADPAAAERTTGYVRGGISPLGQRKRYPRCSTSRRRRTTRSSSPAAGAASTSSSPEGSGTADVSRRRRDRPVSRAAHRRAAAEA